MGDIETAASESTGADPSGMTTYPQKISFGELHASGVRDVVAAAVIAAVDQHIAISADRWPDYVRLSDTESGSLCTACGERGAEVQPNFDQQRWEI